MAFVVKISSGQKINPKQLNIDGSDDIFFRYKVRQLFVQVIGKGKMIRTMFLNIEDVAGDLKVDPSYIISYFGYEIGAQSKFDPKKPERERASISGEHDSSYLSGILKKFIKDFILCPNCNLPECIISPDKKTLKISLNCKSCGASTVTEMNDKLKRFIFNHPKGMAKEEKGPKVKAKAKAEPKAKGEDSAKQVVQKKERRKKPEEDDEDDDGIEWSVDSSASAAEARRLAKLPDKLRELVIEDRSGLEPKELLAAYLQTERTPQEIVKEIERLQTEHKLKSDVVVGMVVESVLDHTKIVTSITEKKGILSEIVGEGPESGRDLLNSFAKLSVKNEQTLKQLPLIFKQLYDEDLVEEEVFLSWEKKTPLQAAKEKAAPFLTWLKTAEEESDGEEDDEDEDEDEDEEDDEEED